ncbi:MAG TPA: hypothetical protein VGF86_05470 [Candidatus Tumulicola sp.]
MKRLRRAGLVLFTAVLLLAGLPAARADQSPLAPPAAGQLPARVPGGQVLPAGPGLPVLPVLGGNRVLYVFAIGSDHSSRSKIIATLAERLQKYRLRNNPWIFAEPDWAVGDYVNQCTAHPESTEGAILLTVAATAAGTMNRFFYTRNWFELDSDAAFITCDSVAGSKPTYGISWVSGVKEGYASRNTYAQLFSAAALLFAAASTVSTFIPSHATATATTTVFPRTKPIPPSGQQVEQVTTSSTTSNPGALANSSAAILAPALAFAPAETAPAVDGMTWNAAEVTVDALVGRMNCPPLDAKPNPKTVSHSSAPFCSPP